MSCKEKKQGENLEETNVNINTRKLSIRTKVLQGIQAGLTFYFLYYNNINFY